MVRTGLAAQAVALRMAKRAHSLTRGFQSSIRQCDSSAVNPPDSRSCTPHVREQRREERWACLVLGGAVAVHEAGDGPHQGRAQPVGGGGRRVGRALPRRVRGERWQLEEELQDV